MIFLKIRLTQGPQKLLCNDSDKNEAPTKTVYLIANER